MAVVLPLRHVGGDGLIGHDERRSGLDDLAHLAVEVFDGIAVVVTNSYHGQTICCS